MYTKAKTRNASKLTHAILSKQYNSLPDAKAKTQFIKEIDSTFPNISAKTAYRLYKNGNQEVVIDPIIDSNVPLKNMKCRLSSPEFPLMEENLGAFLYLCQKKLGIVFQGPLIQAQAILMFKELKQVGFIPQQATFKASDGWLRNFRQRQDIKMGYGSGTTDAVDKETAYRLLNEMVVKYKLTEFAACDIFNIDETALFWRTVAKKGLHFGDKAPKNSVSKDRVTVMLGASMTGEKLPPLVIGKSAQPHNFRADEQEQYKNDPLKPLWYYNNPETAWMNRRLFIKYLETLNDKFIAQNRKVCILCDAPSIHLLGMLDENKQLIIQSFSNILLIYLPSTFTSVLQPLDQGIIRSTKAKYRFELVKKLCANASAHLADPSSNLTTFNLSKHLQLFDAINMIRDAWYNVETSTITNCWIKSTIASHWNITKMAPQRTLNKLHEQQAIEFAKSTFNDLDVHNMFSSFEESAHLEEDIFRDEVLNNDFTNINRNMFLAGINENESSSVPDFMLSANVEEIATPNEVAYKK